MGELINYKDYFIDVFESDLRIETGYFQLRNDLSKDQTVSNGSVYSASNRKITTETDRLQMK